MFQEPHFYISGKGVSSVVDEDTVSIMEEIFYLRSFISNLESLSFSSLVLNSKS